jgi:hypothetical protein
MALDRKTVFLNAVQVILPTVAALLKINPAYVPVIQKAIAHSEESPVFKNRAKFDNAVQQTTSNQIPNVGINLGQVTDAIEATVTLANAFSGLER